MSQNATTYASRAMVRRLCIEFDRLAKDGDPRARGSRGEVFEVCREGRLDWICSHLGRAVLTSNALNATEAGYLLDILAGKPTKLDRGLQDDWRRLRVTDPDAYFTAMQAHPQRTFGALFWRFQNRTLAQLTYSAKRDLRQILTRRQPAA
ncbi:MAG: hypothetical protein AMXMBFR7_33140 [Planctomycetota bacterium]